MAVRIKICGICREADLEAALAAGAEGVGFNFVPSSARFLADLGLAQRLVARARAAGVLTLGVFAAAEPQQMLQLAGQVGLDGLQLHGEEPVGYLERLRASFGGVLWKAFRVGGAEDLRAIEAQGWPCDAILLDSRVRGGALGGTGAVFDWGLLSGFKRKGPLVLAGGLCPENVAEAVARVGPDWVDVASGVESAPGRKDPLRMREFVRLARAAGGPSGSVGSAGR